MVAFTREQVWVYQRLIPDKLTQTTEKSIEQKENNIKIHEELWNIIKKIMKKTHEIPSHTQKNMRIQSALPWISQKKTWLQSTDPRRSSAVPFSAALLQGGTPADPGRGGGPFARPHGGLGWSWVYGAAVIWVEIWGISMGNMLFFLFF